MIKRVFTMLVIVGLLAVAISVGSCDRLKSIPGNVAGQLMNEAGQGMGFIAVQLIDAETNQMVYSENADDNGNFMFKGVDAGTYTLKTIPIGGGEYQNDSGEFALSPGKTLTLTVIITLPN